MFLGPLQDSKPWATSGIEGVSRFLNRAWRLIATEEGALNESVRDVEPTDEQNYLIHSTIKKVGEDIEELHFNTAISQMMIFVNEFTKHDIRPLSAMRDFVLCLSPFSPHIAEELWRILGFEGSIVLEKYPDYDENKARRSSIEFIVQVSSKIRAKLALQVNLTQTEVEAIAKADPKVAANLEGKTIKKIIFVPDKLINFIV